MRLLTASQNNADWLSSRAGKITASRMADVLAFGKRDGKPLKARMDYIGEIIAEILTGEPRTPARAASLDWGHDVEAAARSAYEASTGEVVEVVGFALHESLDYVGASSDGLVGHRGQIQIKCPANAAVHIDTLTDGMPEEHIPQIQAELFVTGRAWSDFVSFDPRMPPHLRLYRQRIERDEAYIQTIAEACASLWEEVQTRLDRLQSMKEAA